MNLRRFAEKRKISMVSSPISEYERQLRARLRKPKKRKSRKRKRIEQARKECERAMLEFPPRSSKPRRIQKQSRLVQPDLDPQSRWYYLLRWHYNRCPEGDIDCAFLDELSEKFPNCPYCDRELTDENRQLEHLRPASRGGINSRDNVAFACAGCNGEKFTMDYDKFMDVRGRILQQP